MKRLPPLAMNLKEIKELLDLVVEKGFSEFELERSGVRIRLKREVNSVTSGGAPQMNLHYEPVYLPPESPPVAQLSPPVGEAPQAASTDNLHLIKSPIVGTFYEAPNPGAPPFVQVGEVVEAGQTLCIIEAMKLMNEIEADMPGEIVKCYVTSGQPVEYGETLFSLRPRRKKS